MIKRRHDTAVAQYSRPVGDLHCTSSTSCDTKITLAPPDHGADEPEQLIDVAPRQKGRRLVEHQEAVACAALLPHLAHGPHDGQEGALDGCKLGNP